MSDPVKRLGWSVVHSNGAYHLEKDNKLCCSACISPLSWSDRSQCLLCWMFQHRGDECVTTFYGRFICYPCWSESVALSSLPGIDILDFIRDLAFLRHSSAKEDQ